MYRSAARRTGSDVAVKLGGVRLVTVSTGSRKWNKATVCFCRVGVEEIVAGRQSNQPRVRIGPNVQVSDLQAHRHINRLYSDTWLQSSVG